MSRPLDLHILSTYYPHLGEHMGFRQVRKHFAADQISWREQLVIKDGRYLSAPFRAARRLTRRLFSEPPRQYMLEDWLAERRLLGIARRGAADILQYLDGEHSLSRLPGWLAGRARRPSLCGLFHLPPDEDETLLEREVVRRLDAVMVITNEQADWFRSWLDPSRVHLVKHGIDASFFRPAPEGPSSAPPWRVVTVGNNYRDYPLLFEVARMLGDIKELEFHVVHRFPRETTLPSNVRVHRGIRDEELAELYRRSHVCLLPLRKVTASNTLMEALASGLPVITSNLYGMRTYVGEDCARFYETGQAEEAAHHVRTLLSDTALRLALGAAGRARAEACTWRHAAETMTAVYRSLSGSGANTPAARA